MLTELPLVSVNIQCLIHLPPFYFSFWVCNLSVFPIGQEPNTSLLQWLINPDWSSPSLEVHPICTSLRSSIIWKSLSVKNIEWTQNNLGGVKVEVWECVETDVLQVQNKTVDKVRMECNQRFELARDRDYIWTNSRALFAHYCQSCLHSFGRMYHSYKIKSATLLDNTL